MAHTDSRPHPETDLDPQARPRLATHVRMRFDAARGQHTLLAPESVLVLNDTGAAIVDLCDGVRTIADIQSELRHRYAAASSSEVADQVRSFVSTLAAHHLLETDHG